MTEVIMPKMGDAMEEGILLEWLKKEGDKVKSGEIIGTIQTDKATLELEAPGTGVLSGLIAKAGETLPVGKPLAAILKDGEKLPSSWGSGNGAEGAQSKKESAPGEPAPAKSSASAAPPTPAPSSGDGGRVKASPLAKKIASEKGVDLSAVKGSGPGGRIVEKDVQSASKSPSKATRATSGEDFPIPFSRLRQITAQRTLESVSSAPHYFVSVDVEVDRIQAIREQFEEEESGKISLNDFIIRACVLALLEMPVVNSTFAGKEAIAHASVHIGIAVAVEDGLTVPVLRNAHEMTLREIGAKSRELVQKARENKLHPDELSGSTFSISNMGMLGIDRFTAIINQPNSAILAVAAAKKRVVPNDEDELEIRTVMNLTASFDHRVIDGAVGAEFLNLVRDLLENPTRLLS